jgi:hypothetical protein
MATRSDTPQNYRTVKSRVAGAGCFWILYIIAGIAWFIMLFFGPFAWLEASDFVNNPNDNFTGYIVNKKTDSNSGYNFYVLELATQPGQTATESMTVDRRVYDVVQVGYYVTATFENDDHLLNATISDRPGGLLWASINNASTEKAKESTGLTVTIIWGVITAFLVGGWFLRPKAKGRTVEVPSVNSQSVSEGTLMIGSLAKPPKMPDLNAFPPGSQSKYFFNPAQPPNQFPPYNNPNQFPPPNQGW